MSKYIDADQFYADVVEGEPFIFDHAVENEIRFMIERAPEVDIAPRTPARWIHHNGYPLRDRWECSNCGYTLWHNPETHGEKYCAVCGCKMTVKEISDAPIENGTES